jgi:hypothetical protein
LNAGKKAELGLSKAIQNGWVALEGGKDRFIAKKVVLP